MLAFTSLLRAFGAFRADVLATDPFRDVCEHRAAKEAMARRVALLIVPAAAVVVTLSRPAAAAPWPMFHHDAQHTGVAEGTANISATGPRVRWRFPVPFPQACDANWASYRWYSSFPLGDLNNDRTLEVVVTAPDYSSGANKVIALKDTPGMASTTPGAQGGVQQMWEYVSPLPPGGLGLDQYSAALVDADGDGVLDVVFTGKDGFVRALKGTNGAPLWQYDTGYFIEAGPMVADVDEDNPGLEIVVTTGCLGASTCTQRSEGPDLSTGKLLVFKPTVPNPGPGAINVPIWDVDLAAKADSAEPAVTELTDSADGRQIKTIVIGAWKARTTVEKSCLIAVFKSPDSGSPVKWDYDLRELDPGAPFVPSDSTDVYAATAIRSSPLIVNFGHGPSAVFGWMPNTQNFERDASRLSRIDLSMQNRRIEFTPRWTIRRYDWKSSPALLPVSAPPKIVTGYGLGSPTTGGYGVCESSVFGGIIAVDADGRLTAPNGWEWDFASSAWLQRWGLTQPEGNIRASAAVADLDGNGEPDVVLPVGCYGALYAFRGSGEPLWRFQLGARTIGSPSIADLQGDGMLEILVGSYDGYVWALDGGGQVTPAPTQPRSTCTPLPHITATPTNPPGTLTPTAGHATDTPTSGHITATPTGGHATVTPTSAPATSTPSAAPASPTPTAMHASPTPSWTETLPHPSATPTPTPSAIVTETPDSTVPSLTLNQITGAPGTAVRAMGRNFSGGLCDRVDLFWAGNTHPAQYLGSVAVDPPGDFTLDFTVPDTPAGAHSVLAFSHGHSAATTFHSDAPSGAAGSSVVVEQTAGLSVVPASGPPGTMVRLDGSGFSGTSDPCGDRVNFYIIQAFRESEPYIATLGSGLLRNDGTVTATVALPQQLALGGARITGVGPNQEGASTQFTVCCLPTATPTRAPTQAPTYTTITLAAAADAWVSDQQPDTNSGANTPTLAVDFKFIATRPENSGFFGIYSLVLFDVSAIPRGSTVQQATLRLNVESGTGTDPTVPIDLATITTPWTEGTVTWNRIVGSFSPRADVPAANVGKAGAVSWDLTVPVQEWVDRATANYGVLLFPEGGPLFTRRFTSSEGAGGTPPRLTITYDASTAGPDIYFSQVEMVQAGGSPSGLVGIPFSRAAAQLSGGTYIAGKSAMVRVYVGVPAQTWVSGSLTGYACNTSTPLGPPLSARGGGTIIARTAPRAVRLFDTLNFLLPRSWLYGCVDLAIQISDFLGNERPEKLANNTLNWRGVSFSAASRPPILYLVPLYLRNTGALAADGAAVIGTLQWVNDAYPVPDDGTGIDYRVMPQQYDDELPDDRDELLDDLDELVFSGFPSDARVFGMVPCNCGGMARRDGTGPMAGRSAWGSTVASNVPVNPQAFENNGMIWAQEIAHTFGRRHASNYHGESDGGDVDPNFPDRGNYFHGGIGQYGLAVNTDYWKAGGSPYIIDPAGSGPSYQASHAHDFMSYGFVVSGGEAWVSPYTYAALFRAFGGAVPSASAARLADEVEQLLVVGHVNDATGSVALRPFYRLQHESVAGHGDSGEFSMELLDAGGATLNTYRFDAPPASHNANILGFSELVPWRDGTVRIVLRRNGMLLAERAVSPNAPTVRVLSPNGGETLGEQATITWEASDADGDALTFIVLYNTGTSEVWLPIARGLTAMSYTLPTAFLPGSEQARIRVRVTDGVNTSEDESDGPFVVPQKQPIVVILHPAPGEKIFAGAETDLHGGAYDAEDGPLPMERLTWTSDRDGELGRGHHVHTGALSPGTHTLTLTATDSDGEEATAQVGIEVSLTPLPATPTETEVASPSVTPTPTLPAPTATATAAPCTGDCDASGDVSIDELIRGVRIALGDLPLNDCSSFDRDHDGAVTIDEIIVAVNIALAGCP